VPSGPGSECSPVPSRDRQGAVSPQTEVQESAAEITPKPAGPSKRTSPGERSGGKRNANAMAIASTSSGTLAQMGAIAVMDGRFW
jgi:hypothetical protein